MAEKRDQKSPIWVCNANTAALRKVNKSILYYLDRIPLKDQKDVVKLNNLIEEQEKLVRVRIRGHVPLRVEIFNDNERYRANHLRRRFREAQRRDRVRAATDKKERKEIYFGNKRAPMLHLPDCRWVRKMSPENIVVFTLRNEAINQGYVPCKVCRP